MLSTVLIAHPFVAGGWPIGLFIAGHLLGFLLFVLLIVMIARGASRRAWRHGYGHGFHPYWAQASRSAESTLAERFANGDIDEKEYRARLEVLRANQFPAAPPKG